MSAPPTQLSSSDPADWPVAPGWQPLVDEFFGSPAGLKLVDFLHERLRACAAIFPPRPLRALELTPPEAVRVVILGQDPYPTPGHAMGLAFSVNPDVRPLPASLRNIFKELADDTGDKLPNGDLSGWARQGVLLLNTHLSVPAGDAGGHARLGWERLTAQVMDRVSRRPTAFVLWGAHAQKQKAHMRPGDHLVLESVHPSPLSAARGFFGTKPFSKVNAWLAGRGEAPIDWGASG
jgi:uracil-DNA glycosylase